MEANNRQLDSQKSYLLKIVSKIKLLSYAYFDMNYCFIYESVCNYKVGDGGSNFGIVVESANTMFYGPLECPTYM